MADVTSITQSFSRRGFIKAAAQTAFAGALACAASPVLAAYGQRELSFVHTLTGERMSAVYFRNGAYDQTALLRVAYVLRDFHSGDVRNIDPMLLDTLFELQVRADHDKPYQIISGYRNPATNAELAKSIDAVAEHSMHIQGRAIDIRVSGVSTKRLRDLAVEMKRGGVGYYPNGNSLHLDTGRIRTW
jgi:uncharacterized protein YcbK (DUF882 family)